jgi:hypothetical protein
MQICLFFFNAVLGFELRPGTWGRWKKLIILRLWDGMYLVYVISLEMKNTEEPRLGCETDFSLL